MIGILGTGLIGTSIGLRARANGERVLGHDAVAAHARQARERGGIDDAVSRETLYERCDVVVISTPPGATCEELRRIAAAGHACSLIADVASVKEPVLRAAAGVRAFVATHPFAGRERSGPGGADAALFEGCWWAYVPTGDRALEARVHAFATSMGAKPFACEAALHDRIVAVTSHLPQLLAWELAERMGEIDAGFEQYCGPAGREVLRLARSSRELWDEIVQANANNVRHEARELARRLLRSVDEAKMP